jgi:hypothetical protein
LDPEFFQIWQFVHHVTLIMCHVSFSDWQHYDSPAHSVRSVNPEARVRFHLDPAPNSTTSPSTIGLPRANCSDCGYGFCAGDLGAIDAKYDVAVSTAVGALDYIVVETTSDAQRCVEYLRK